jgi:hypothetical protein
MNGCLQPSIAHRETPRLHVSGHSSNWRTCAARATQGIVRLNGGNSFRNCSWSCRSIWSRCPSLFAWVDGENQAKAVRLPLADLLIGVTHWSWIIEWQPRILRHFRRSCRYRRKAAFGLQSLNEDVGPSRFLKRRPCSVSSSIDVCRWIRILPAQPEQDWMSGGWLAILNRIWTHASRSDVRKRHNFPIRMARISPLRARRRSVFGWTCSSAAASRESRNLSK